MGDMRGRIEDPMDHRTLLDSNCSNETYIALGKAPTLQVSGRRGGEQTSPVQRNTGVLRPDTSYTLYG